MKKIILFLGLITLWGARAQATNLVFISQSGTGDQSGLTDCTHAKPASYFNIAGNWSGSPTGVQIGPDTTVHLCGTITTTLAVQGNGSSGHPWTLFFESGAKISHAFCGDDGGFGCLNISGHQYFIIDGGTPCGWINNALVACNGVIEATANGTLLANQSSLRPQGFGVYFNSSSNWEFRNIELRNLYVHSGTTDTGGGNSEGFAVSDNQPWSNIHIHNFIMHDLHWGFTGDADPGPFNNLEMDHFVAYHMDHVVGLGMGGGVNTGFLIHDFHIYDPVTWDVTCCGIPRHHDGIHFFGGSNSILTGSYNGVQIYNGLFDGDWGVTNTANIFLENIINATIFNNLFYSSTNSAPLNNGVIDTQNTNSGSSTKFYNNTMIWTAVNPGSYLTTLSYVADYRNNVVINTSNTGNTALVRDNSTSTTAFWDYNAYASVTPTVGLFGINTNSCCGVAYSSWKVTPGNDTHSPSANVFLPSAIGINQSTGVPNTGSPVIATGTNLTSLGIPALNIDRNGAVRSSTGPWTMGALNSGTAPPTPGLAITPNPASFGSVNVGVGSSPVTLTVTSNGTATATLGASIATFSDPQFARIGGTCTPSQSLTVGSTCTVIAVFTPTSAGVKNATVTVGANATASAGLSGTGTAGTASMSVTPSSWNFGNVTQGTASAGETFLITNTGSTSITMSIPVTTFSGTNAGDFSVFGTVTNNCTSGQILAPGGTCQKSVIVTPSIVGAESATVTISSTTASASATLTATGTAVANPSLLVTPRPLALSNTIQGQTSPTVTGTVTNNGNVSVTLAGSNPITISGVLSADFSLSSNACTANLVLAVNATCTFNVSAVPSGITLEQVNLTATATNTTNTVALQIQGLPIAPIPAPSPALIISTQIDLFPMPKVTVIGQNFVVGKTQITIDGSPQATVCASATSCTAQLAQSVLLPWLWGNWPRYRCEMTAALLCGSILEIPGAAPRKAPNHLQARYIQSLPGEFSAIFDGRSSDPAFRTLIAQMVGENHGG